MMTACSNTLGIQNNHWIGSGKHYRNYFYIRNYFVENQKVLS